MIIGISGKIGSGKDTAGDYLRQYTGGEVRKFADALKDCVCRILGCTREQLEDREFKETPLGEEWGLLRETSSYGAPDVIYPLDYKDLTHIAHTHKEVLTPRKILQLLGTEAGRQIIHPNIWVNATFADYKPAYKSETLASASGFSLKTDDIYPTWIITDMRFPNELQAVKDRGGITIRLNRGDGNTGDHPSETALDNTKFDYVIDNNGTLTELASKLGDIVFEHKLS